MNKRCMRNAHNANEMDVSHTKNLILLSMFKTFYKTKNNSYLQMNKLK